MMTVKQLKELLKDAPDDMQVLILAENQPTLGGFLFTSPCTCETGIATIGQPDTSMGEYGEFPDREAFLILPHGSGVTEEGLEQMADNPSPERDN